jgi:hypothetical protein
MIMCPRMRTTWGWNEGCGIFLHASQLGSMVQYNPTMRNVGSRLMLGSELGWQQARMAQLHARPEVLGVRLETISSGSRICGDEKEACEAWGCCGADVFNCRSD